ncbi:type IV secretory pathway VirB10-like protein [Hamadaea flava]|uniref:MarR family transcriptional regulator n=1 Tax=Hamadaea flava TaxID=1742688 RepID=A0ABV8LL11_9ACTN|nr:helix-turn-helix domain-containing protein [Hamadaea flava]MCP2323634.1 type IV secretory pathway VirB10-like protein [Hamadaea flava]
MTSAQQTILTDLQTHGPATPAVIAERTGLGYSTVTASLRKIAAAGHVHRDDASIWTAAEPTESTEPTPSATATAAATIADGTDSTEPASPSAPADERADEDTEPQPETSDPAAAAHEPDDRTTAAALSQREEDEQPEEPERPEVDEEPEQSERTGPIGPDEADGDSSVDDTATPDGGGPPDADAPADKPRRPYTRSGKPIRKKHQLQAEVLAYLTAHPGQQVTPHTIGKAIDAADGAVINACNKLAHEAKIQRVETTKAMFVYDPDDTTAHAS